MVDSIKSTQPRMAGTAVDLNVCCLMLSFAIPRFRRVAGSDGPPTPWAVPVGLRSVLDSVPNLCSIRWAGGDLARPWPGTADRGAAGAVRGAARRRPGRHPGGGRQRRTLPPHRRHQDLEPHAAGTPAPARGLRPAPRRLPGPPPDPSRRCRANRRWPADHAHRSTTTTSYRSAVGGMPV